MPEASSPATISASRIWRDDTFVDFDSSLRVAVGKLRDALGDDAENPRYVETIPRRGYRFLAPRLPRMSGQSSAISSWPSLLRLRSNLPTITSHTREKFELIAPMDRGFSVVVICRRRTRGRLLSRRSRKVLTEKDDHHSGVCKLDPRSVLLERCGKVWQCSWNSRLS